jgi:NarL family two-component system response regulator LiaR
MLLSSSFLSANIERAHSGKDAILSMEKSPSDLVLMDLRMKNGDGIQATMIIKQKFPACKIIIVSQEENPHIILSVIDAGADAFVEKGCSFTDILQAIKIVCRNLPYFSPEICKLIRDRHRVKTLRLSQTERDVLSLHCSGKQSKEIGFDLHMASSTVSTHLTHIREKYEDTFPHFSNPMYLYIALIEGIITKDDIDRLV